jgi:hypothetical protein
MIATLHKPIARMENDRALEAGIEWIVARQLAPMQDELLRLRAYVEALVEMVDPS